jgi:protein-tyrosine phosphatase
MMHNFAAAVPGEQLVHGAGGPRTAPAHHVAEWVAFMRAEGIARVVRLLDDCEPMRRAYDEAFGAGSVLHIPIADAGVPAAPALAQAVAFIDASVADQRRVVVHCMAGMGRTAIVLAAWLVRSRAYDAATVDVELRKTGAVRRLYEKVEWGVTTRARLHELITGPAAPG